MGKEKTARTPTNNSLIIKLYDTHFHTLMGVALHLTRDEKNAEELIANTFAKVCQWQEQRLKKIATWDAPAAFTYLSNTLANTHIDEMRKKTRRSNLEKNYAARKGLRYENSPESQLLAKENIRIIRKAYYDTLAEETKVVRVAFYLRSKKGLKNKEIADRLNISPNTIGTQFRRLRIKIKEKLG